jgi:hypothetical protein
MSETQKPTAERYRDTAVEIRLLAQRTRSSEIRLELFDLADRYERMAVHAEGRSVKTARSGLVENRQA